jgi:Fe-S cluster assembly protein SufD
VGDTSAFVETRNGHVVARTGGGGPVGVAVASELAEPPEDLIVDGDAFVLANRAYAADPVVIRVAPGATAAPVVVVHWVDDDDVSLFPRIRLEAGADSEITLLEVVAGPGRALVVPVTELDLAPAARVSYLQVQSLGPHTWQIARQASRVAADARLVSAAVALGGDYARLRTDSALVGRGASSRLVALYFGAGTQMHDFRTSQDHRAPKTTSDLLYKGAVANTSRSVYSGLIRVEKGAGGTNAFQTNRNLVLHEGAHADSVPNLEIEDNDVRCSHASAVGPVSEDERFYLESRGVPPEVTERLITLGFLGEVIGELPLPQLAPFLFAALADKLAEAESVEASR